MAGLASLEVHVNGMGRAVIQGSGQALVVWIVEMRPGDTASAEACTPDAVDAEHLESVSISNSSLKIRQGYLNL